MGMRGRVGRRLPQIGVLAVLTALAVVFVTLALVKSHNASAKYQGQAAAESTAVETTQAAQPRPPASDAMAALADPHRPWTLLVVGDSTGNDSSEWVQRYALALGQSTGRPVTLQRWDPDASTYTPVQLTQGTKAAITVWNGSAPGRRGEYVYQTADTLLPAARPDLVIYNFGHNAHSGPVALRDLTNAFGALDKRWSTPVAAAAILQNPQSGTGAAGQEEVVSATAEWAGRQKVTAIDVHQAFVAAGNLSALLLDDEHPNAAGSQLWEQTVLAALAPPA